MTDFLNNQFGDKPVDFSEKKAIYFKRVADSSRVESLGPIFQEMFKTASDGKYILNLKQKLSGLDFYCNNYDEDDEEEWEEGFRAYIEWEDASED